MTSIRKDCIVIGLTRSIVPVKMKLSSVDLNMNSLHYDLISSIRALLYEIGYAKLLVQQFIKNPPCTLATSIKKLCI